MIFDGLEFREGRKEGRLGEIDDQTMLRQTVIPTLC